MFRGYIQKLEEKDNSIHKRNIPEGHKFYGFFSRLPELGKQFNIGSASTSLVTEILTYDTFLTLNSKYQIIFEKVEGLLVHKNLKDCIYVRGLYGFPSEDKKYLTIDKKTFIQADKNQMSIYQDLLIPISTIFEDYVSAYQIFKGNSWFLENENHLEVDNFTAYKNGGDSIFKINEEEGLIFHSEDKNKIGDRIFYQDIYSVNNL